MLVIALFAAILNISWFRLDVQGCFTFLITGINHYRTSYIPHIPPKQLQDKVMKLRKWDVAYGKCEKRKYTKQNQSFQKWGSLMANNVGADDTGRRYGRYNHRAKL